MGRVLQRHKDKVLQVLAENSGPLSFSRLQGKAGLVSHVLENVVAELRSDGLVTLYNGKYWLSRDFNHQFRHAEARKTPTSIRRAENGSKQKAKTKTMREQALAASTVGGVAMFDYKVKLLKAVIEDYSDSKTSVADNLAHILEDFERLAMRAEKEREAA